jgi:hypothetical protein
MGNKNNAPLNKKNNRGAVPVILPAYCYPLTLIYIACLNTRIEQSCSWGMWSTQHIFSAS